MLESRVDPEPSLSFCVWSKGLGLMLTNLFLWEVGGQKWMGADTTQSILVADVSEIFSPEKA